MRCAWCAVRALKLIVEPAEPEPDKASERETDMAIAILVIIVVVALLVFNSIKVLKDYDRGVIFTLGKFRQRQGTGHVPGMAHDPAMIKVDLRTIVMDVPPQDVISRDNVSVKVNAVIYFRIVDPEKAIIQVADVFEATSQLAQTTLRSVLGQHELDDMLAARDKLNVDIQRHPRQHTDAWGMKVPTWRSSRSTWTKIWSAPSPNRRRPNVNAAPR